jgi:hypothetical protein
VSHIKNNRIKLLFPALSFSSLYFVAIPVANVEYFSEGVIDLLHLADPTLIAFDFKSLVENKITIVNYSFNAIRSHETSQFCGIEL